MELGKMGIEDLLSDESFINYCKKTSAADIARWESLKAQSPDHKALIESARIAFIEMFNALAATDLAEQETRLRNRLNVVEQAPVVQLPVYEEKRPRKIRSLLWKLAVAAVVIVVAGYALIIQFKNEPSKEHLRAFVSAKGERKNFQLPDGSVVTLNAGSKITIDASYGVSTRDIYLQGEAFFDVKHDKATPFIVHTPAMDIKALGTSFNVKAYPCEKSIEASLVKGLVEVTLKDEENRKVLLHPNQKIEWKYAGNERRVAAIMNKKTASPEDLIQSLTKTNGGDLKEIAWTENKLVFADDSLEDIAVLLGRWYGVNIEFADDAIRNYRFTGEYEKEELATVLSFLKESKNFNYEIIPGDTTLYRLYK
jgi:transmembrane sensor